MLQKDVYPYEYTDDWKKINETLPEKEDFYSHLNMEDITGSDYAHSKIVCKDFESKVLGKYHELYAQSDTLLLAAYLRTLNLTLSVSLKYMNLILLVFFQFLD